MSLRQLINQWLDHDATHICLSYLLSDVIFRDIYGIVLSRYSMYNDTVEGKYICYKNGKMIKQIEYSNNNMHGEYIEYYELTGKIKRKAYYMHNRCEGENIIFYENGRVEQRTEYVNGRKHGDFELWYPDGTIKCRSKYAHNQLHGKREMWYANGSREHLSNSIDGKLHGELLTWYDNKQLCCQCFYNNGVPYGVYKLWHFNGQLSMLVHYNVDGIIKYEYDMHGAIIKYTHDVDSDKYNKYL